MRANVYEVIDGRNGSTLKFCSCMADAQHHISYLVKHDGECLRTDFKIEVHHIRNMVDLLELLNSLNAAE